MKYTNTHAHLYRNKRCRQFDELAVGDKFTKSDDSKFYCKIVQVERPMGLQTPGLHQAFVYNAVRIETGELAYFEDDAKCIVAKDVRVDAKF